MSPASDQELLARQSALQREARVVFDELDLAALVAGIGPLLVAGSFVTGQVRDERYHLAVPWTGRARRGGLT